ncbi:hypothetical protein BDR26DRAFT_723053 [Obelidium mucronatum]|nr:hypothetical protein BDR26DRAFT_723053 [Obelidium mucronatum]
MQFNSAKQIISGGPPISIRPVATVCFICHMLDIVFEATLEHKNIPESTFHILNSTKTTYLQHRIDELKAKIPFDLLLLIQDGTLPLFLSLSPTQLETMRVMDVLMVSMLFNSTICIIYRTCLYLTSFLTLTSPQLLVPENLTKLLMVLETCVTSARTITALNTWILNLPATTDVTPGVTGYKLRHNVFMEQSFTYFALFEAAVVLWFVTTKTQTFWWRNTIGGSGEVLSMTLEDRRIIRSEVLDLLHTLRDLEELHSMKRKVGDEVVPNMITPLVRCVAGMVDEMEQIENSSPTTRKPLDAYDDDDSLDFVVLGMKAMMIDGSPNVDERMDVPWVFLGLLGVDVGKMRWNGALESQWRSFWKRSVAQ